jgi:hypothetical protein
MEWCATGSGEVSSTATPGSVHPALGQRASEPPWLPGKSRPAGPSPTTRTRPIWFGSPACRRSSPPPPENDKVHLAPLCWFDLAPFGWPGGFGERRPVARRGSGGCVGGWCLTLNDGSVRRSVVVAIGLFWCPKVPDHPGCSVGRRSTLTNTGCRIRSWVARCLWSELDGWRRKSVSRLLMWRREPSCRASIRSTGFLGD